MTPMTIGRALASQGESLEIPVVTQLDFEWELQDPKKEVLTR